MGDGVLMKDSTNSLNMGATTNANGARFTALQERKKSIEEALTKKEKELRELCLQEADLTGIIPSEMPLQPGESPPSIRRKVGTSYMLPENLLKSTSNKDESIVDLELQLQLHANMAEAALGLAHKQNLSKTVRRQHKSEYQHHKKEYKALQEKIILLKEAQQQDSTIIEHQKQKKKPRPSDQDDGISIKSNDDALRRCELRQSIRSSRHTLQTDNIAELYPQFHQNFANRNSEITFDVGQMRYDDLSSSFYKLNLSGYKSYLERREHYGPMQSVYNQRQPNYQHIHGGPTYPAFQLNHPAYSPIQQASPLPQHSPLSQHSSAMHQAASNLPDAHSFNMNQKYNNPRYYSAVINPPNFHNYAKYSNNSTIPMSRQSSPNSNTNINKVHYSSSPAPSHNQHIYKNHSTDAIYNTLQNPHQLQPHQQYEHNAGLGGCWKKKESGEVIWCNSSNTIDTNWQRDKRFGSLDRRRNRRIQKRISPNADNRSATMSTMPYSIDEPSVLHSPQVQTRHSQDRQLVRTQSLGSVGVQTLDSVWPSDDNSSCDSENRSMHERSTNTIRRQKQKEWRETSLDSSASPTSSIFSRSNSTIPPMLAAEERYIPTQVPSPIMVKAPLEIPAESNPSPRIPDTKLEIFNNNIPKNCTIVQAGHCKPYHEETKPFEMSDFYKYSTKFKKSPAKSISSEEKETVEKPHNLHINLNKHFDDKHVYHHNILPTDSSLSSVIGELDSFSGNVNFGQLPLNSQDNYSQDINRWYSSQSSREKENNNATLV
ncbi:hypothetical protein WA026_004649 [Henosepilachna vigintioctopunctata]|uniref:Cytohesin Ubiquitin Protein Inducing domain-containing protein n=1 Tax=Henosepilachna vigintioctopunctata TaxID=420089 RepID=A0AAW1V2R2_9CUCU